jgi:DNA-nicking Smr family endonuclease
MARRRSLSSEERDLWAAVARSARPLSAGRLPLPAEPAPPAPEPEMKSPAQPRLAPFRLGERAVPRTPGPAAPGPTEAPLAMDARTHRQMTRGRLAPDARLDLHGMTLAEAHGELIRFLLNAQADGDRLVLVITGKSRPEAQPRPTGLLRQQVPHWLRLPPLSAAVQQVREAHLRHGGAGALYVWLRRR